MSRGRESGKEYPIWDTINRHEPEYKGQEELVLKIKELPPESVEARDLKEKLVLKLYRLLMSEIGKNYARHENVYKAQGFDSVEELIQECFQEPFTIAIETWTPEGGAGFSSYFLWAAERRCHDVRKKFFAQKRGGPLRQQTHISAFGPGEKGEDEIPQQSFPLDLKTLRLESGLESKMRVYIYSLKKRTELLACFIFLLMYEIFTDFGYVFIQKAKQIEEMLPSEKRHGSTSLVRIAERLLESPDELRDLYLTKSGEDTRGGEANAEKIGPLVGVSKQRIKQLKDNAISAFLTLNKEE